MERRFTPGTVSRRYGVQARTVIDWCEAGLMPAINVARPGAHRKRWRMSEDDIEAFEQRRKNRQAVAS